MMTTTVAIRTQRMEQRGAERNTRWNRRTCGNSLASLRRRLARFFPLSLNISITRSAPFSQKCDISFAYTWVAVVVVVEVVVVVLCVREKVCVCVCVCVWLRNRVCVGVLARACVLARVCLRVCVRVRVW